MITIEESVDPDRYISLLKQRLSQSPLVSLHFPSKGDMMSIMTPVL